MSIGLAIPIVGNTELPATANVPLPESFDGKPIDALFGNSAPG